MLFGKHFLVEQVDKLRSNLTKALSIYYITPKINFAFWRSPPIDPTKKIAEVLSKSSSSLEEILEACLSILELDDSHRKFKESILAVLKNNLTDKESFDDVCLRNMQVLMYQKSLSLGKDAKKAGSNLRVKKLPYFKSEYSYLKTKQLKPLLTEVKEDIKKGVDIWGSHYGKKTLDLTEWFVLWSDPNELYFQACLLTMMQAIRFTLSRSQRSSNNVTHTHLESKETKTNSSKTTDERAIENAIKKYYPDSSDEAVAREKKDCAHFLNNFNVHKLPKNFDFVRSFGSGMSPEFLALSLHIATPFHYEASDTDFNAIVMARTRYQNQEIGITTDFYTQAMEGFTTHLKFNSIDSMAHHLLYFGHPYLLGNSALKMKETIKNLIEGFAAQTSKYYIYFSFYFKEECDAIVSLLKELGFPNVTPHHNPNEELGIKDPGYDKPLQPNSYTIVVAGSDRQLQLTPSETNTAKKIVALTL